MKKLLVVGLGFGKLYVDLIKDRTDWEVKTLDLNHLTEPDYGYIEQIHPEDFNFDMAIISVPNYAHFQFAEQVAKFNDKPCVILVEKPGVQTSKGWEALVEDNPDHKILMVKNNIYRPIMTHLNNFFFRHIAFIDSVDITWINHNRVPWPGHWFTDKEKAFGGVSKDLLPHLIHMMLAIVGIHQWDRIDVRGFNIQQNYDLYNVKSTEYGEVNCQGIYNVDDYAHLKATFYETTGTKIYFNLRAEWKSPSDNQTFIKFNLKDNTNLKYDFGLCPDYVYYLMLESMIQGIDDQAYRLHNKIDLLVHDWTSGRGLVDEYGKKILC